MVAVGLPFYRNQIPEGSPLTRILQRISLGFASMILASVIVALVERKREDSATQMSLFWLAPQFFLRGVSDVTSFPGLPRVLQQRGATGHEIHRDRIVLVRGWARVIAGHFPGESSEQGHETWAPGRVARG